MCLNIAADLKNIQLFCYWNHTKRVLLLNKTVTQQVIGCLICRDYHFYSLVQFDNFVEETLTCTGERWFLVTDGQFPLRHHLHLEAGRKKAKLSQHFYSFYDLKKEVQKAVKHDSDFKDLEEVASCILSLAEVGHVLGIKYLQLQIQNI